MHIRLLVAVLTTLLVSFARAEAIFPLGQSAAQGRTLPPPYLFTASYYSQQQDYSIENLTFDVPGFTLPNTLGSENESRSVLAQPGLWLLPFAQVYGIVGRVDNETTITRIPVPGAETLTVKSHGIVYGGGVFLVGGWEEWFGGVATSFTYTDLDVANGSIRTLNISPRIGRNFSWGSLWLGGNFLDSSEKASGVFQLPPGFPLPISSVTYSAEFVPSSKWNALVGARYALNRHVAFTVEAGFIERTSVLLSVEFAW
jgi:hypothetical protein